MTYSEIEKLAKELPYREKFRLAQAMIQMARKEEEETNVVKNQAAGTLDDIKSRILKSKPVKKAALENFVKAMYNFKGGVSDEDLAKIIKQLEKEKFISIDLNNRVTYL